MQDVIELLSGFDGNPRSRFREAEPLTYDYSEELSDEPADISGLLTVAPVSVDEIIRQSDESAAAVQLALLELEIVGKLVRHAGGRVSIGG